MSSTLPQFGDAILRASFPAGSSGSCYLWERSEIVDEDARILTTDSWYELTFGDLPGRSVYAESLLDSSSIERTDITGATALAAAWIEAYGSRGTELRVEDRELAAKSRVAGEYTHEDKRTSSRYFVWHAGSDGGREIIADSNCREDAMRRAAQFYVARTLVADAEPRLYLSQSRQDVGDRLTADRLLIEARQNRLSPELARELGSLLAARSDNRHPFQASTLSTGSTAPSRVPAESRSEWQVLHTRSINRELECRASEAISRHGESSVVISFFSSIGGMPTVANADYFGVKQAVRQVVAWAHDAGLNRVGEKSWWPILRKESDPAERESLVGFVLEKDGSCAKWIADWALDFGLGPENLRVDPEPQKFPGLRDSRYVMWTVDSEGLASNYTSDRDLANVANVAALYEDIARSIDGSAAAPIICEWVTSSEPPGQIRLPRANEPGEHLEFDCAVLGRQVPEREIEFATDRRGQKAHPGTSGRSDPNYIVWEERRDGTARWRACEMNLDDAKERALEISLAGRKKHGELSITRITAWNPRQELPARSVPAASLSVVGVPIDFDIHKEIQGRYQVPPRTVGLSEEPAALMYGMHVVRVQSTLQLKPGDYLDIREGKDGERIGYLRGQGFGADQQAARPQYAVARRDNNQVVSGHDLEHYAYWALEPYLASDHAELMRVDRQHLPPLPDQHEQTQLPAKNREQAVEPERETQKLERTDRFDEASVSLGKRSFERPRRTGYEFER